ncbi:hypothetical protein AB5I41_02785 [Sphingomonas sp. MMS24-JH45]
MQLSLLKANFTQSTYELSATRCPVVRAGASSMRASERRGMDRHVQQRRLLALHQRDLHQGEAVERGRDRIHPLAQPADLTYNVVANYQVGEMVGVGAAMTGQTTPPTTPAAYPGKAIFNGNLTVMPIRNVSSGQHQSVRHLRLRGNGGVADASVSPTVITGAPALGQTYTGWVS